MKSNIDETRQSSSKTYDGKIIGDQQLLETLVLYYNKDLIRKSS